MHKSIKAIIVAVSLLAGSMFSAGASGAPTAMKFAKAWSSTTAYVAGDVVTYGTNTYVAIKGSTDVVPSSSATHWTGIGVAPNSPSVGGASFLPYTDLKNNLGGSPGTLILSVPITVSGEYAINTTALLDLASSDSGAFCYVSYSARGASSDGNFGGLTTYGTGNTWGTSAVNDFWFIDAGEDAELYCYSESNVAGTEVYSAGMTVTLIADPAKAGLDADAMRSSINNRPEMLPPASKSR
jgi:hypothetical protein